MTEIYLGPPGTGKTTTLINLVVDEVRRGTPPDRIAYVSFTRKAAREALERACERLGLTQRDLPHFVTLHSLCFRQLGLRSSNVLEGRRLMEFAAYAGIRIESRWSEDGTMSGHALGDRILHIENLSRVRGRTLEQEYQQFDDNLPWNEVQRVVGNLREYKRAHSLVDYTEMLQLFLRENLRLPIDVLLVDEGQDLSHLQWQVVHWLARGVRRLVVAGDDDQAIYRWAGADVEHLIDLEGDATVLGQSYRVPLVVQQLAHDIIGRVGRRREKQWRPRPGAEGRMERAAVFSEVDVSRDSTLVLVRNSYVAERDVVPWLRQQGMVYEWHGHSSVNPELWYCMGRWEALRRGESILAGDARRVYKWMSARVGMRYGCKELPAFSDDEEPVTMAQLRERGGLLRDDVWYEALDRVPNSEMAYLRACMRRTHDGREQSAVMRGRPRVVVSTIHSAKGGEADHVVLMREIAPRSQREMQSNPDDEARVWYVAVTRARERLTIVRGHGKSCPFL